MWEKRGRAGKEITPPPWKGSPATLIRGDSSTFHINALSSRTHCSWWPPSGQYSHTWTRICHFFLYVCVCVCVPVSSWTSSTSSLVLTLVANVHCFGSVPTTVSIVHRAERSCFAYLRYTTCVTGYHCLAGYTSRPSCVPEHGNRSKCIFDPGGGGGLRASCNLLIMTESCEPVDFCTSPLEHNDVTTPQICVHVTVPLQGAVYG